MSRSLLLKGLGGVGVIAGAGSLVVFREKIFGVGEEDLSGFKHKELIDKVGLDCQLSGDDIGEETKVCTVKDSGTINVEVGGKKEEGVSFTGNGSKLKVSKSENGGYSRDLKFVVDSGDLALTKDGGTLTHFQKLEQFETYEVKKVKEKFYLKRKTEAKEGKKEALGLGECGLPGAGDSNCSLTTEGEIKKVKFQGQEGGVTVKSGTVTLKISRVDDSSFTDGYRFTFTFPQDLTINNKTLKGNTPYDFKIKKGTENTLTLEKAWESDDAFTKKAGLKCETNKECSVSTETQKLNVRVGDKKKEGITNTTGGKIKMETDKPGYNQGLKFSISERDVTLTGGTGDETITKLEELETYEITEEGGKWYLSRKNEAIVFLKKKLGFEFCTGSFGNLFECNITDVENLKKIKFDSMDSFSNWPTGAINVQMTIEKDSSLPLGLKFTFIGESDNRSSWYIPTGSGSINLNDSSNTGGVEYKIKKTGSGESLKLTLEKKDSASGSSSSC